jgi:hypothetical protein
MVLLFVRLLRIYEYDQTRVGEKRVSDVPPQVLVVGNPANTNCLIAMSCAPSIFLPASQLISIFSNSLCSKTL